MTDRTSERKALAEKTIEELLRMANEVDAMRTAAVNENAKRAFERVATCYRVSAETRARSGTDIVGLAEQLAEIASTTNDPESGRRLIEVVEDLLREAGLPPDDDHDAP